MDTKIDGESENSFDKGLWPIVKGGTDGSIFLSREQLRVAMSTVFNNKKPPRLTLEDVLFGPEKEEGGA